MAMLELATEEPTGLWWCPVTVSVFKIVAPKLGAVWQRPSHSLLSHSFKVEEAINGVESLKMGDGEEEEVKQPRVTKAQKRRVN